MSLITAYEVLKYSPAGNDYPTAQFCELIPQIEQEFARDCLGQELYDYFVSKLTAYPATTQEWDASGSYCIGDVVIRNGCLFISVLEHSDSDPLLGEDDWEPFERFTDAQVNIFWEKYLRRLLALKVYSASLLYTTWRAGAGGLTIAVGDGVGGGSGFRAATKAELSDVKTGLIAEIERVTANMLQWIKDNSETSGFPTVKSCSNDLCATPGRRARRWAWKV